jgi:hypothetical protein
MRVWVRGIIERVEVGVIIEKTHYVLSIIPVTPTLI